MPRRNQRQERYEPPSLLGLAPPPAAVHPRPARESTPTPGLRGARCSDPGAVVTPGAQDTAAIPEATMLAQVTISDAGDVTVTCDTESDTEDEVSRLAGLAMDALVERAATAAVATWFEIHTEAAGDECNPAV